MTFGITSLRHRTSIFPLEPFANEHESIGEFVPIAQAHISAKERLLDRAMGLSVPTGVELTQIECRRFDVLAGSLSLYYYPFWIQRKPDESYEIYDAVSGLPEKLGLPEKNPVHQEPTIFDQLQVIELKCNNCHEPLPSGNHSVVLPCKNCGAFWQVTSKGLESFKAYYTAPQIPYKNLAWLPFWQIEVALSYASKVASKVKDLVEVLGVLRPPGNTPMADPNDPLTFYVPAYGSMRVPRLDHAARDLTRVQPLLKQAPTGQGELFNCFYTAEDAAKLSYASWIQILPGTVLYRLRSLRTQTNNATLWYLPFDRKSRELISLVTGISYEKSSFRGVCH